MSFAWLPPVERIPQEWDLFDPRCATGEDPPPMWRVTVDDRCVDFEMESGANAFRNAIERMVLAEIERVRSKQDHASERK